jgi:ring-1,2-phenylacetyl-CoA epoxidase subunit PaaC
VSDHRLALLLALADDELVTGQRLAEWTGWVPYLEEDLALSSIAQDELGHARVLYEIASALDGRDVDALALGRAPEEYRNAILCERPNRDYAYTAARHYLYDTADRVRLQALTASAFAELAAAARTILLEERFHVEHARLWLARLAGGPVEARMRLAAALAEALPEAVALFEPLPEEEALLADGTLPGSSEALLDAWLAEVERDLEAVGLVRVLEGGAPAMVEVVPTAAGSGEAARSTEAGGSGEAAGSGPAGRSDGPPGAGGRRGIHSEDFLPLWEEMTGLYRAHPGARW